MDRSDYILFSGGAPGAEAEFGAQAERYGIEEVNFGFEGHIAVRARGLRILNHEELKAGDVSLAYVSQLMNRRYTDTPTFRKVLQSIWYQVNAGQEIFVVGTSCPTRMSRVAPDGARSSPNSATSRCMSTIKRRTTGSRGMSGSGLPARARTCRRFGTRTSLAPAHVP